MPERERETWQGGVGGVDPLVQLLAKIGIGHACACLAACLQPELGCAADSHHGHVQARREAALLASNNVVVFCTYRAAAARDESWMRRQAS